MLENYGKFNRGVGESQNPVFFYFIYNNYFNSNVCDVLITHASRDNYYGRLTYKVIWCILFWWHL